MNLTPQIMEAFKELDRLISDRVVMQNTFEKEREKADQAVMMARGKLSALLSISAK